MELRSLVKMAYILECVDCIVKLNCKTFWKTLKLVFTGKVYVYGRASYRLLLTDLFANQYDIRDLYTLSLTSKFCLVGKDDRVLKGSILLNALLFVQLFVV